ncbi:MAG: NB-ARC domain protein (modular protein), partial [bacterium]|nr:NB-ARC domain protein (modular protein) [bacterium]
MTRTYYTYRLRITSPDRVQAEIRDAANTVLGEPSGTLTYSETVRARLQEFHHKAGQGMLLDAEVEQFGEALFATLFDEGLRHDFFTRYRTAREEKALLRIELDVDEDQLPEVAALPWEFLRVPSEDGYGTVWFGTAPDLIFSRRRALWTA